MPVPPNTQSQTDHEVVIIALVQQTITSFPSSFLYTALLLFFNVQLTLLAGPSLPIHRVMSPHS